MQNCTSELEVHQVNCFYNYTIGLGTTDVNLLSTATTLLKSGMTRAVCFSDLKCLYLDENGDIKLEWLQHNGRQWDLGWTINFSEELPRSVVEELTICLELSFHEQRIENPEARQVADHIRAALPPIILEKGDMTLPIFPWLKVFSDGIMILSFQLDTSWDGLSEADFISEIVNIYQRYFDEVWVQAKIQRLDADQVIPDAFQRELSIGGQNLIGRKMKKLMDDMRAKSRLVLDESLKKTGRDFDIGEDSWILHQIAGSEKQENWEATIELCRSIYVNALASLVVSGAKKKSVQSPQILLWHGRPSISLMRFRDQPYSKEVLLKQFSSSLSRLLLRTPEMADPPALPLDLRPFDDYCFHANRSLLLWTWLRPNESSDDSWEDSTTRAQLLENQSRAEHFEYHNMRIARASAIANSPPSDNHLIEAYEVLASANTVIHHSSKSGEITDALSYLMSAAGTRGLIESGKEQARWHLDERRYRADKSRSRVDRLLAIVFGFVGAAGLADLVIQPFLEAYYDDLQGGVSGLVSFLLASVCVSLAPMMIWIAHKRTNE